MVSPLLILCLCLSSVFSREIVITDSPKSNTTNPSQGTTDVAEKADGVQRACPACSGIGCDANMTISGLPIIQVFIAFGVGLLWAKVFVWLFKNFHEKKESFGGGGGDTGGNGNTGTYGVPTQQYGMPQTQYGAPLSSYGTPTSQYGAPSSRSLNTDFLALTKTVLEAIKDFSES